MTIDMTINEKLDELGQKVRRIRGLGLSPNEEKAQIEAVEREIWKLRPRGHVHNFTGDIKLPATQGKGGC